MAFLLFSLVVELGLDPSTNGNLATIPRLNCYLKAMFPYFITLVAALAVLMFAWGGLEHMFSQVPGAKVEGKKRMKQAIIGLALALGGWLILHEVNPQITNQSFIINQNAPVQCN
jgi:accessory gene regulator protein AgrB